VISEPNDAELAWVREHIDATAPVVVSDEHGTEMAVHREAGDVLVFPANLVAKRWETRHTGFLRPLYDQVAEL
jgi:Domain of unknown function (DUF3806)